MNEALRTELERMYESDQEYRKLIADLLQKHGQGSSQLRQIGAKLREIDDKNIKRLEEIIEQHGWPGRSLVGERAAQGAFLVLQHAELSFQEKYLPLLRQAKDAGELQGQSLALLEDRVLMGQGKDQIYGSQLRPHPEGGFELWPIGDEPNVDRRRAEVGLGPLADYLRPFGLEYVPKRSL